MSYQLNNNINKIHGEAQLRHDPLGFSYLLEN